jgi:Na+/H+ antiporter NhaD/arsenite permease-like protein
MHFLPALVTAISMFVIGGVWYSLFAKLEAKVLAPGMGEEGKPPSRALLQSFVVSFITALIFQRLFYFVHTPNALHGVHTAVLICVATVVASKYMQKVFRHGSWRLFFIDSGYQLVSYAAIGAILGGWKA